MTVRSCRLQNGGATGGSEEDIEQCHAVASCPLPGVGRGGHIHVHPDPGPVKPKAAVDEETGNEGGEKSGNRRSGDISAARFGFG